jgi:hypothetical protein
MGITIAICLFRWSPVRGIACEALIAKLFVLDNSLEKGLNRCASFRCAGVALCGCDCGRGVASLLLNKHRFARKGCRAGYVGPLAENQRWLGDRVVAGREAPTLLAGDSPSLVAAGADDGCRRRVLCAPRTARTASARFHTLDTRETSPRTGCRLRSLTFWGIADGGPASF